MKKKKKKKQQQQQQTEKNKKKCVGVGGRLEASVLETGAGRMAGGTRAGAGLAEGQTMQETSGECRSQVRKPRGTGPWLRAARHPVCR